MLRRGTETVTLTAGNILRQLVQSRVSTVDFLAGIRDAQEQTKGCQGQQPPAWKYADPLLLPVKSSAKTVMPRKVPQM